MRNQLTLMLIGLASLAVIAFVEPAGACSCGGEPAPCEAFSRASAVFVGKVLDAAQQIEDKRDGIVTVYDVGSIRFQVTESFAGVTSSIVVIHSGTGGGDCGYWFKRGESYLVYAFGNLDHLSTFICTRTRPLAKADEDLVFLRDLPKKGTGGDLYGVVTQYVGDADHGAARLVGPMAGIKVIIEGAGGRRELLTDAQGRYHASGLQHGDYDVRLDLPANLGSRGNTGYRVGGGSGRKTQVYGRGCTVNSFIVQPNGRVGGRVTDPQGKPANDARVNLVDAVELDRRWTTRTDANGRYQFTLVQPGRYLLGVNLEWLPNERSPYAKTYYPGVVEQVRARVIGVGEGEKLEGVDFFVGLRLVERSVVGFVVWPDGRPAVNARVFSELRDNAGKSSTASDTTDSKGRFLLSLIDGRSFVIFANAEIANPDSVHSKTVELTPSEKTGETAVGPERTGQRS